MKKIYEINASRYMFLLHIRSTPISPLLSSPAMLMFNRLARGLLPRFSTLSIQCDNDESHQTVLQDRHPQSKKETDTHVNISLLHAGSTVVVQFKDFGPWVCGTIIGHGSED